MNLLPETILAESPTSQGDQSPSGECAGRQNRLNKIHEVWLLCGLTEPVSSSGDGRTLGIIQPID